VRGDGKRNPSDCSGTSSFDLSDGISPDFQMTIGAAEGAIKNTISCDSTENFD